MSHASETTPTFIYYVVISPEAEIVDSLLCTP